MKILGIHSYIHDSGACLINGAEACAISEERLSRIKYDASFPKQAIEYVIHGSGLSGINEADLAVFDLFEKQGAVTEMGILESGFAGELVAIGHHDAHAASAFFCSTFDDAAVLIVDGAGSRGNEYPEDGYPYYLHEFGGRTQEVQSFYRGRGNLLHLIRRTYSTSDFAMGVGFLYGIASEFLGFGKLNGGKLMGLAAYGKENTRFRRPLFVSSEGDELIPFEQSILEREDWKVVSKELFGGLEKPGPGREFEQEYADLARYVQEESEAALVRMAQYIYDMTGAKNLCMAGGVALNGIANKKILERTPFKRIFVQPASNDSGVPLGCALWGKHVVKGLPRDWEMKTAFLGKEYGEGQTFELLKKYDGIKVERHERIWEIAARAVARGGIVGWFQGGSEFGPRALGNRSILADPRDPNMKEKLNERVKHREKFRPYAPAVLEERATDYFDYDCPSPFMLLIGQVKPEHADEIPAVVHADGTARVQTVNPERNGHFYHLIKSFESETGIPMVLNTSFNTSGEPIVETPEHALIRFLQSDMDALAIGRLWIEKK
jgi:carbamoyltransferase